MRQRSEAKCSAEMKQNSRQKNLKGFTLAEVLITLVIVGVIAAITISALNSSVNRNILNNQFKKTYSTLSNAVNKTAFDNGTIPDCFYYKNVGSSSNRSECTGFNDDLLAHLVLSKRCDSNAYENGCVPDYTWTVWAGCDWFSSEVIKLNKAYVLNDGSIIFFYGLNKEWFPLIGFDVNGFKKPNKPGFDVYAINYVYDESKSAFSLGDNQITQCLPDMGGVSKFSDIMGK